MILLHCVTHLRLRRIRAIWQVQLHFELCQASVKTNLAKIHLEYLPKKLQSPSQLLDFFRNLNTISDVLRIDIDVYECFGILVVLYTRKCEKTSDLVAFIANKI